MSAIDGIANGVLGISEQLGGAVRKHVVEPMQRGLQTFSQMTQSALGQSVEGALRTAAGKLGFTDPGEMASLDNLDPAHVHKGNELLPLARDVYNPSGDPPGWTRLDGSRLNVPMEDPKTGFQSALYQNEAGEVALAFRGTSEGKDWLANLDQGLNDVAPQYQQAIDVARAAKETFGDQLVAITGHSLGGGLATAGGLETGVETFAFNGAGLADHTLEAIGEEKVAANQDKIVNFNNAGDPLSDANGLRDMETWGGKQQGTAYWFPSGVEDNLLDRHSMDNQENWLGQVSEALEQP